MIETANPLMTYLPFLAILAPMAMFWGQVKVVLAKICGIFIIKTEFMGYGETIFNGYLSSHARKFQLASFDFAAQLTYTTVDQRHVMVGYESVSTSPQLYKLGRCFFVAKTSKNENMHKQNLEIYAFRWTINIEKHYIQALKEYNNGSSKRRSFKIMFKSGHGKRSVIKEKEERYAGIAPDNSAILDCDGHRILGYTVDQIGYRNRTKITSGYVFSKDAQIAVNECESWRKSESWYKERGILWRRGIILTGAAGTGKSSLVRKICQILDIPLIIFDLASMSNSEMIEAWKDIQQYSPCAVLFDDIDRVFHGNTNIAGEQGGGLTLDCLLGCISGAMPAEGVLVFATVNDASKLDPALGIIEDGRPTRPGRFDLIIELSKQSEEDRRKLAAMIFEKLDVDIEKTVQEGEGMTAAQFNDYCSRIAVDFYWKKQNSLDIVAK